MKPEDLYRLRGDIAGLSVFVKVGAHPLIKALVKLLKILDQDRIPEKEFSLELVEGWGAFTGAFLSYNPDVSFYTALAALTLADENLFTLAVEAGKGPDSAALLAVIRADLSRLGRIARFDVSALGFYIAGLLRDGGLEEAARECEASARALWRGEGAGSGLPAELFPEDSDWGDDLPKLGEYIAAHRGLPGAAR
jgi:hypothetical protein